MPLRETIARLESALRSAPPGAAAQIGRAIALARDGLVGGRGVLRWLEAGAKGDIVAYLAEHGFADDATLDRERLLRAGEVAEAREAAARGAAYGPYVRLQKIGDGPGSGTWKAWDTRANRLVAMRTLRGDASRYATLARAMMGLAAPGVIAVRDVGRRAGETYVVSDYAPGINLRLWAAKHERRVLVIVGHMRAAIRALQSAHELGFVHGAVHPENVIVTAPGAGERAYVGDFAMCGDPLLTAPEHARGALPDERADVYGVGATLFAVLAGHAPFARPDQVATAPVPSLRTIRADIPDTLAAAVAKCLEKDPARRFASMSELDQALQRSGSEAAIARGTPGTSRGEDLVIQRLGVPGTADAAVLVLAGAVTTATMRAFQDSVQAARARGAKRIVFDLERVRFISSGGFGYLITLSDELRVAGGAVALSGLRTNVRVVYDSLGLDAFFVVVDGRDEALRRIAPDAEPPQAPEARPARDTAAFAEAAEDVSLDLDAAEATGDAAIARALLWRIESLLRMDETSARPHALRARALLLLGDLARAESSAKRAGRDAAALAEDIARRRMRVSDAWKGRAHGRVEVERELARHPDRPDLLHLRAVARRGEGDAAGAVEDLTRVFESSSSPAEALVTFGLAMRAAGDEAQAAEQLSRALRVAPRDWALRPHVEAMAKG